MAREPLVYTVKDRCRVCYSCVRECPAKAIKISNGQAEIILERCIACGNCVKVCSQGAKNFLRFEKEVLYLLESDAKVIACIAPSFPAEFEEIDDYKIVVGMLRKLGFYKVVEVGFGADVVAKQYKDLLSSCNGKTIISSDCPAIVTYVKQYHPELINNLAPLQSPMIATKRIVNKKYGDDVKVVFIGPCIAKKWESNELDFVITFSELREMLHFKQIIPDENNKLDFDEPKAGGGAIFPISRGMLQTMGKNEKIGEKDIIAADGQKNFTAAIQEFEEGTLKTHYLELLCCEGCIQGAGMSRKGRRFSRRTKIKEYVNEKITNLDAEEWQKNFDEYKDIELSRTFDVQDRRLKQPSKQQIDEVLRKLGKFSEIDHLNCGACGYNTCVEHANAIIVGLAEAEMCLPYTIEQLHNSIDSLNVSNNKLATAKQALKQSEKLASMGQLSAGIAHELNNPLGVITMYSNILKEEVDPDAQIYKDLELITEQAERCKNIVGGLLNFARKNQTKYQKTDILKFTEHSIEAVIVPKNIEIEIINNAPEKFYYFDYDQMMQVFNNLEKNAFEAMPDGGKLLIEISETDFYLNIKFKDTGSGISKENLDKIFTPFFTTKPLGKGTGLGLPLIYGIVKMHKGKIDVESNDNPENGEVGTSFIVSIPKKTNN
ncbi:MAG: 4Fe-4S binding protein [Bacteroidales bacterium]|nr:4Fe-4S binding protein [Bacteroidales bacterium]